VPPSPPSRDDVRSPAWIRDFARDLEPTPGVRRSPAPARPARRARADERGDLDLRRENRQTILAFVRDFEFHVEVPGSTEGGFPYDELLDVLEEAGRDFRADSRRLRDFVKIELLREFEDYPKRVTSTQLSQFADPIIIEWICKRFDLGGVDVRLTRLSPEYARRKRREGWDSRIGIRTGGLRGTIESDGHAVVTV
jgi:hypothetical protein